MKRKFEVSHHPPAIITSIPSILGLDRRKQLRVDLVCLQRSRWRYAVAIVAIGPCLPHATRIHFTRSYLSTSRQHTLTFSLLRVPCFIVPFHCILNSCLSPFTIHITPGNAPHSCVAVWGARAELTCVVSGHRSLTTARTRSAPSETALKA